VRASGARRTHAAAGTTPAAAWRPPATERDSERWPHPLVYDCGASDLGPVALRLVRIGLAVHYARWPDEALLLLAQEGGRIRALVVPPDIEPEQIRSLQRAAEPHVAGASPGSVVVGVRPPDETRHALRGVGASSGFARRCSLGGPLRTMGLFDDLEPSEENPQVKLHRNAKLAPATRGLLVQRIRGRGWPVKEERCRSRV
jgi:hypothetical protein